MSSGGRLILLLILHLRCLLYSPPFHLVLALNIIPEIHSLLHEEEQQDGADGEHERPEVHGPAPAGAVVDEAGEEGREVVRAEDHEHVHGHVVPALVGEEQVRDRDLRQGLDGRRQRPQQAAVGVPLPGALRVRRPHHRHDRQRRRRHVHAAPAVRERQRLPRQAPPPEEQEHQPRAEVQLAEADGRVGADLR